MSPRIINMICTNPNSLKELPAFKYIILKKEGCWGLMVNTCKQQEITFIFQFCKQLNVRQLSLPSPQVLLIVVLAFDGILLSKCLHLHRYYLFWYSRSMVFYSPKKGLKWFPTNSLNLQTKNKAKILSIHLATEFCDILGYLSLELHCISLFFGNKTSIYRKKVSTATYLHNHNIQPRLYCVNP